MQKLTTLSVLLFLLCTQVTGQNQYGLKATSLAGYRESIKIHPEKELVDLTKEVPGLMIDIRYATNNNFTGQKIYRLARAYARRPVAAALKQAQADFHARGFGIKIYDAYRPYKATVRFYELYHDTTYVASPYKGSRHNRGCALDMTLVDLKTGRELKMPTEFDSFKKEAWPSSPVNDPEVRENRALIIHVMENHGFKVNTSEWWHFDFVGWQRFEVLDIDFEELEN